MICIIFAPPRYGKTCLMTHLLREYAFDRNRFLMMRNELINKNNNGFKLSIPSHPVSSNYDIAFKKFGYSARFSRRINPYKLGFANDYVQTHFNLPFEVIGITEAQKYLNSRMSAFFPDWQSRWYEQHGHNNLDIFLDTQRPMLIDVNIRELARFIEVVDLSFGYDDFGKISSLTWIVRDIDNSFAFDKYMSSGKKDSTCYDEREIVADYNVFEMYDSQCCKPKFYDGHFRQDFDIKISKFPEQSLQAYMRYLREFDDELPDNFYVRKKGG